MDQHVTCVVGIRDIGRDGSTSFRIRGSFGRGGLAVARVCKCGFFFEKRWNRVFPPFQVGFAAVLLMYPALVVA